MQRRQVGALKGILLLLLLLICSSEHGYAQAPRIRVNFNCLSEPCHKTYLTTELSFFDVVRDRFQADVQIVMVRQTTGGGGTRCTVRFIGQNAFADMTDSTAVEFPPAATDVQEREMLLEAIRRGLMPYVLKTPWKELMVVKYPARQQDSLTNKKDRWRSWIFQLGADLSFEGESNRRFFRNNSWFSPYRITARSKFIIDSWYNYSRTQFTLDSQTIVVPVSSKGLSGFYAVSLDQHWSAGTFISVFADDFSNIRLQHRVAPAIEYNVYPFSENTRRQLRFAYQVGYRHYKFIDSTIYDHIAETRPYHRLAVVAAYAQPWGTASGVLQYHGFLDGGFRQSRLTANANISLRLFEGFSLRLNGSTSLVNDQISLSKREATDEQLLLRGAQLPTRFLYGLTVGFSYTFGSTNNSVINPRFDNTD